MIDVIGKRKIWLTISTIAVVVAVASIAIFGFRLGIDFVGGTLWQVEFNESDVTKESLTTTFEETIGAEDFIITEQGGGESFFVRLKEISEDQHQEYKTALESEYGELTELRFETIGASIGREVRSRAITAFVLVLIIISFYIAFVFRKVSKPVNSWKYGLITLVTLFHDAIIPAGLIAFLGTVSSAEVDTNFIVAILVVIGFSVHDTIVVFDRVREHLKDEKKQHVTFEALVNESVNETFARSLNTSITLVLVLVALLYLGSSTLFYFILTILVGTLVGTYSSIFLASPLLTIWKSKK
jgi:preprotein translocase subunit SecF